MLAFYGVTPHISLSTAKANRVYEFVSNSPSAPAATLITKTNILCENKHVSLSVW